MAPKRSVLLLVLLGVVLIGAISQVSARQLKQDDDDAPNRRRRHDECDCDADCHTDEFCSKGNCELKRDDGETCDGDEQCLSGTCHHSWVFGSSCATLCKSDDDCPHARSVCNTNPYNPYGVLLAAGKGDRAGLLKRQLVSSGEQPEQPEEDDDDDDEDDDDDDGGEQPEQPEEDEDEEQDEQDEEHVAVKAARKAAAAAAAAADFDDDDEAVDKKHKKDKKKKRDDDDDDDKQTGICVECMEDKDCGKEEYCQRGFRKDAHTCAEFGKTCASFGDCPQGEYCDTSMDRCRPYYSMLQRLFSFTQA